MYNYHLISSDSYLQTNNVNNAISFLSMSQVHTVRYLFNGMTYTKTLSSGKDRIAFIKYLKSI